MATDKSVLWFTGVGEAVELLPDGATNLWWGDGDVLYYRTMEGDIMAIVGLEDFYVTSATGKNTVGN